MATLPPARDAAGGAPAVSVIVPAYNVAPWIGHTLQSVLGQRGFDDFEVLVVDDRSQDGTAEIVQGLAVQDRRLRLLRNDGPQGAAGARNHGLAQARGEWLAFLDGDDLWMPDNLRLKMQAARAHPDVDLISSDYVNENRADRALPPAERPAWRQSLLPSWAKNVGPPPAEEEPVLQVIHDPLTRFLRDEVLGNTGTFVLRRARVMALGGFDTTLEVGEDVFLWLQVARECPHMLFVHRPLMYYRYRPGSLTNRDYPAHAFFAARFYDKLLRHPRYEAQRPLVRARLCAALLGQNFYFRRTGARKSALQASLRLLRHQPASFKSWKALIGTALGS